MGDDNGIEMTLILRNGPPWGFRMAARDDGGIFVSQVLFNGNADQAGLEVGDLIEVMAKCPMTDLSKAHEALRNVSGQLELSIRRESADSDISLINENHPPKPLEVQKSVPDSTKANVIDSQTNLVFNSTPVHLTATNVIKEERLLCGGTPFGHHIKDITHSCTTYSTQNSTPNLSPSGANKEISANFGNSVLNPLFNPVAKTGNQPVFTTSTSVPVVNQLTVTQKSVISSIPQLNTASVTTVEVPLPPTEPPSLTPTTIQTAPPPPPKSPVPVQKVLPTVAPKPSLPSPAPPFKNPTTNRITAEISKFEQVQSPSQPVPVDQQQQLNQRSRINIKIGANDRNQAPRSASLVAALSRKPPPAVNYSGGFQGSASDKKRFFEVQAARLVTKPPNMGNFRSRPIKKKVLSPGHVSRTACSTPTSFDQFDSFSSYRSETSTPTNFNETSNLNNSYKNSLGSLDESIKLMEQLGQELSQNEALTQKIPPPIKPKPKSRPSSCLGMPFQSYESYQMTNESVKANIQITPESKPETKRINNLECDAYKTKPLEVNNNVPVPEEVVSKPQYPQPIPVHIVTIPQSTKVPFDDSVLQKPEPSPVQQPQILPNFIHPDVIADITSKPSLPTYDDLYKIPNNNNNNVEDYNNFFEPQSQVERPSSRCVAELRDQIKDKLEMVLPGGAKPQGIVHGRVHTPNKEWSSVSNKPIQLPIISNLNDDSFVPPGLFRQTKEGTNEGYLKDNLCTNSFLNSPNQSSDTGFSSPSQSVPQETLEDSQTPIQSPSLHQGLLLRVNDTQSPVSSAALSPVQNNPFPDLVPMTPQSTAAGTNGYAASAEETEEEGLGPLRSLEEMRWYREMYKKMQCLNLNGDQSIHVDHLELDPQQQDYRRDSVNSPNPTEEGMARPLINGHARSQSVPKRYDPVADMDLVDRYAQERRRQLAQQQRFHRGFQSSQTINGDMNRLYPYEDNYDNLCKKDGAIAQLGRLQPSPTSSTASSSSTKPILKPASSPRHFHIPSFRLMDSERPRSAASFRNPNLRDCSWMEIEEFSQRLGKQNLRWKHRSLETVAEKVVQNQVDDRLTQAAKELDQLLEDLQIQQNTALRNESAVPKKELLNNGTATLSRGARELKRLQTEEAISRQRAGKLTMELDEQRARRHGYVPNLSPSLQNNFTRLDQLLVDFDHSPRTGTSFSAPLQHSYSAHSLSRKGTSVATATALYKFVAQTPRELSLNKGDVVRIHREVDDHWIEGERNGQIGLFPASYVQMDQDPTTSGRNRVRAMYPFQARNSNELSLKAGEILKLRRRIDAHWVEGSNSHGQIGIFPQAYVKDVADLDDSNTDSSSYSNIPDRPKTPKLPFSASETTLRRWALIKRRRFN